MRWSAPGLEPQLEPVGATVDVSFSQPGGLREAIPQTLRQTLSAGVLAGSCRPGWPAVEKSRSPHSLVVRGVSLQVLGLFAPGRHVGFLVVPGDAACLPADLASLSP